MQKVPRSISGISKYGRDKYLLETLEGCSVSEWEGLFTGYIATLAIFTMPPTVPTLQGGVSVQQPLTPPP